MKMYYIYYLLDYFYLLFTVNLVCCPTAATAYAARRGPRVVLCNTFTTCLEVYHKLSVRVGLNWTITSCFINDVSSGIDLHQ